MEGKYGKGDPKHPLGASIWLASVSRVTSRADRVRGFWVNDSTWFEYEGDAADFNNFLKDYTKVPGAMLSLESKAQHGLLPNMSMGYDWGMSIVEAKGVSTSVTLYVDGRIPLETLQVPLNISLTGDLSNADIAKFVTAHKARQAKAKQR